MLMFPGWEQQRRALVVVPRSVRFRRLFGGILAWDDETGTCYLAGDTTTAQEQLLAFLRLRRPGRR